MLIHVESENQLNELIKGDRVLVDFFAIWCGPCMRLTPTIEKLADEYPEITFLKVDVDQLPRLAASFNVSSIPLLIYLEKGNKVREQLGWVPEPMLKKLVGIE